MTQVLFSFQHPDGTPLADAEFTVQLRKAGLDPAGADSVVIPQTYTFVTGADGTYLAELQPSTTVYSMNMSQSGDVCGGTRYKFYVPHSDEVINALELYLAPPPNSEPWDETAIAKLTQAVQDVKNGAESAWDSADRAETAAVTAAINSEAASSSAQASAGSASAALASQQTASASATAAGVSASTATVKATEAAESAAAADTSEAEALASKNASAASATAAADQASAAAASALVAKAGETASKASETAAKASETAAAASASAAQDSEEAALASVARFLASAAVAPTVRDDGTPLQFGDRYLNTGDQIEYVYKTTGWVANNLDAQDMAKPGAAAGIGALINGQPGTVQEAIDDLQVLEDALANLAAASIKNSTVVVPSVQQLLTAKQDATQVIRTMSWLPGLNKGGGSYIWFPSALKSLHDGGRFISPTVPYATGANQINFMRGVGETQPTGSGCFVLLCDGPALALTYGLLGDGVTDQSVLAQHFVDKNKGRAIQFERNAKFLFAGLILDGATYDKTEIDIAGEHIFAARPSSMPANFLLAWVGIGIRDCDGVRLTYRGNGNRAQQPNQEHAFNVRLAGVTNFDCPLFRGREIRGDGIYIGQKEHQVDSKTSNNLHFGVFDVENSEDDGRNGMSIIAGHNIDVDVFRSYRIGALVGGVRQPGGFDIEPNYDFQTVRNVHLGKIEIRTAGNFGLQVIGQSRTVLGGNVSGITFDSYHIESTLGTENVLPVSFRNCSNVRAKGSCAMTQNGGFVNSSTLGIDNAIDCVVEHDGSGGTYGARIAIEFRVVDLILTLRASDYDGAACQAVYVSRSTIKIRGRSGRAGTRALHVRRFSRTGVAQEDIVYEIDCPKAGTSGDYGAFNEPADAMTFSNVRFLNGNLRGYPTFNNRLSGFGSGVRRLDVPEVNDASAMPTEGTWFAGDVVNRSTPALIAASNMTLMGWIRLTTGSANVLGTDWGNMYVSHVAPAT